MRYKPYPTGYHHGLYRFTRAIARIQQNSFLQQMPFASGLLARGKAFVLKRQHYSHDFGMVAFVKELIDECGMADITHPQFGIAPVRVSKFREMRITHSQAFIVKA